MTITIRPGLLVDAGPLAEFAAGAFRDTFAAANHPDDIALHLARTFGVSQQSAELVDADISTILAEAGGSLAGYAQLRCGPAPGCVTGAAPIELRRLYVAREWHGQGVAQALLDAVDAEVRRRGARTLWLGVWERNERARAFYHKQGFVDVGSHLFMLGTDEQTDRLLVRSVEPADRRT